MFNIDGNILEIIYAQEYMETLNNLSIVDGMTPNEENKTDVEEGRVTR